VTPVALTADGRRMAAVWAESDPRLHALRGDRRASKLPGQRLGIDALALTTDRRAPIGWIQRHAMPAGEPSRGERNGE